MTRHGVEGLETGDVELAILVNVGNLVCPAEFDTGASKNAMILSVPEGDDKPLKYPLMFSVCDVVLINKTDALPYFDFDMEKCREYIRMRNPKAKVIPICAKTGEGIEEWTDWLKEEVREWREKESRKENRLKRSRHKYEKRRKRGIVWKKNWTKNFIRIMCIRSTRGAMRGRPGRAF